MAAFCGYTNETEKKIEGKLGLSGGTMTGEIDMNNNRIKNIPDPVNANDPVNKVTLDKQKHKRYIHGRSRKPFDDKDSNGFAGRKTVQYFNERDAVFTMEKDDKVVILTKGLEIDSDDPVIPYSLDIRSSISYMDGTYKSMTVNEIINNRNTLNYKYSTSGWTIIIPNGKTIIEMKAEKLGFAIDFHIKESKNSVRGNECVLYWMIDYEQR